VLEGQSELLVNAPTYQETVNATTVTNAQLQTMIDQGVTAALTARDALRSTNGDDSHNSGTGVRRTERAARECTYTDFLKYRWSLSRLRHVLENTYEDDDGQILPSKRDQETRNETLRAKGLPDMIHGSVVASKPKTMQEAIKIATELMDKKNTDRVYTATSGGKKQYGGSKPLCAKCNITTMVHVLLSATTATKLVILRVTVGLRQMPIMLTTREALGQDRNHDVMSVEFKDILGENVLS
nr:hypothetical protein [Tanacetum cinerariifolium]